MDVFEKGTVNAIYCCTDAAAKGADGVIIVELEEEHISCSLYVFRYDNLPLWVNSFPLVEEEYDQCIQQVLLGLEYISVYTAKKIENLRMLFTCAGPKYSDLPDLEEEKPTAFTNMAIKFFEAVGEASAKPPAAKNPLIFNTHRRLQ